MNQQTQLNSQTQQAIIAQLDRILLRLDMTIELFRAGLERDQRDKKK